MSRKILVASAAALAVLIVGTLSLAMAHSRPVRFDVAPGAVLSSAPASITGWFTADIRRDPNWSFIHVNDAQGNRVDTGDSILSTDRRQMTATLKTGLGNGRYLVTFRTFDDADGAIFGSCYTFFVGQEAATAAQSQPYRLDGGRDCASIDVSAKDGTPVPGVTPTAVAGAASTDDETAGTTTTDTGGDSGDIPVWALVVGIAAGVVVGGLGGRLLSKHG